MFARVKQSLANKEALYDGGVKESMVTQAGSKQDHGGHITHIRNSSFSGANASQASTLAFESVSLRNASRTGIRTSGLFMMKEAKKSAAS